MDISYMGNECMGYFVRVGEGKVMEYTQNPSQETYISTRSHLKHRLLSIFKFVLQSKDDFDK